MDIFGLAAQYKRFIPIFLIFFPPYPHDPCKIYFVFEVTGVSYVGSPGNQYYHKLEKARFEYGGLRQLKVCATVL